MQLCVSKDVIRSLMQSRATYWFMLKDYDCKLNDFINYLLYFTSCGNYKFEAHEYLTFLLIRYQFWIHIPSNNNYVLVRRG